MIISNESFVKKFWENYKKLYFSNLDIKKVVDDKRFWKTVPSIFSTKYWKRDEIIFNEGDKCVSNDVNLFVATSQRIFLNFKLQVCPKIFQACIFQTNPIFATVNLFQNHRSIKSVRAPNFLSAFLLDIRTK